MAEVDLINRDPNDLNGHVKCEFEDVLGEPEAAKSIDCVWKLSYTCFNCCRNLCYKLITLFCGICMAIYWGVTFAAIAVQHVWCITPELKVCTISCNPLRKMWNLCVDCCMGPLCEACGLIGSKIKITKS